MEDRSFREYDIVYGLATVVCCGVSSCITHVPIYVLPGGNTTSDYSKAHRIAEKMDKMMRGMKQ